VHIDPTAVIEPGATISSHCVIGPECYIMSGARLGPRVVVGQGTVIRENAVVGGYGFGLARSAGKPTLRIPHFGGVQLGNDVEIGALTTVCSGTIDPTIIEDGVKIDDRVHIAHNCHLEPGVIVVAGTCISGSCRIGARTWFGPNSCTREKTTIGPDCLIGAGAVVLKSLEASQKVFGNPARTF
jgi:UDP-3-O-[3-hydroxymyristoyl] glucosamine N-acyltransferase